MAKEYKKTYPYASQERKTLRPIQKNNIERLLGRISKLKGSNHEQLPFDYFLGELSEKENYKPNQN